MFRRESLQHIYSFFSVSERENESADEEGSNSSNDNDQTSRLWERIQQMAPEERESVLERIRAIYRIRHRSLYDDYSDDEENEFNNQNNTNNNFIKDNQIDFRDYPLKINWEQVENDKLSYYSILNKFGYFGVSLYTSLIDYDKKLTIENFITNVVEIIYRIFKKNKKKEIENFIKILPSLNNIKFLINQKMILFKELPAFIIIFKVYELYLTKYINKFYDCNEYKLLLLIQFKIIKLINDEEYKKIIETHFKGRPSKTFELLGIVFHKEKKQYEDYIKKVFRKIQFSNDGLEINKFII